MITSLFTSTFELQWYQAYSFMSSLCLLMALVNICFLVTYPEDVSIHIDEIDDQLNETERLLNATLNNNSTIDYSSLRQEE